MEKLALFTVFILTVLISFSQVIGGDSFEKAYDMSSNNSSLFLSGYSSSYGNGNRDAFIIKYDCYDKNYISSTWGKVDYDEYRSICKVGDGFIVAGFSYWREDLNSEIILTKIDSEMEFQWTEHYGNADSQQAYMVYALNSGEYLVGGVGWGPVLYNSYLIKTTCDGEQIWECSYNDYTPSHIVDAIELENGNVLLLCSKGGFFNPSTIWHETSHENADILFVEINSLGEVVCDKIITEKHHDIPVKILAAPNDKFYVLFHSQSYSEDNSFDICLGLLNSDYEFEWVKTFGGEDFEYAADMEIDGSNDIHIVGTSASQNEEFPTIMYIKTNNIGEELETKYLMAESRGYGASIEIIDRIIFVLGTLTIDGDDNFVLFKNFESEEETVFIPEFYIYPNPVITTCKVNFEPIFLPNSDFNVKICNLQGQLISDEIINVNLKNGSFEIDVSLYKTGQYIVNITNSTSSETIKIMIVKK